MIGESGRNAAQRRRNYYILSVALVLISALLLLSSREGSSLGSLRTAVDDALAPAVNMVSSPLRAVEGLIEDFGNRSSVMEENERLRTEISRLKDVENRANILAMKLSRFEDIFNTEFGDNITDVKIPARAVMETDGPFVRSALLSVGADKGVTVGSAVMTTDGLFGHIVKTGQGSSRALLLGDLNSRIAIMSLRSGERAILTGDNSATPKLSFVEPVADWQEGDEIITSGDAGILPRGLPVGNLQASKDGGYFVKLHHRKHTVDWVWIYPFSPIAPPEDLPVIDGTSGADGEAIDTAAATLDTTVASPNELAPNVAMPNEATSVAVESDTPQSITRDEQP